MESRTTVPVVSGNRGKGDVAEVVIACVSGLLLAYTVLFLCILPLVGKIASGREFTIYWATGQQLVHHAPWMQPDREQSRAEPHREHEQNAQQVNAHAVPVDPQTDWIGGRVRFRDLCLFAHRS